MIYKSMDGEFKICPFKVRYTDRGEVKEAYTNDRAWWEGVAEKHEHIAIIVFDDVVATEDQLTRIAEVQGIPERHLGALEEYVELGVFPEGDDHPLRKIQLERIIEDQAEQIVVLSETILMGGLM